MVLIMKIVLASRNKKKIKELGTLFTELSSDNVEILSLDDIGFYDDIVEDGTSFEENAYIKASTVAKLGYIAVADDSGISVDALGGAPGIYSARYSGEGATDESNNAKLIKELSGVAPEKRTARYVCAVCCAFPDGKDPIFVKRTWEGLIVDEPRGNGGFGYDPYFYLPEYQKTAAELTAEQKNAISHRGLAMKEFVKIFDRETADYIPAENIGIYGGTFAPVHNGHINAALEFLRQTDIEKLYIVPDNMPPHKNVSENDDPMLRLEMLNLAFGNLPEFGKTLFISDHELRREGKSYTVYTLEHFKTAKNRITFLCGTDMFLTLDTWKNAPRIFELARIAFIRRENETPELNSEIERKKKIYTDEFGADIIEISTDVHVVSSTEVREALASKSDTICEQLPASVYDFILKNKLYN